MIKNIIFDIGRVLADFAWKETLTNLGIDKGDFTELSNATVKSPFWGEFDRSAESDEDILLHFIENAPHQEANIRLAWEHIQDMIHCYPYTYAWLQELKAAGYHRYYLSNYPRKIYEITKDEIGFIREMEGGLFSFDVQLIKPEEEIYLELLHKYNLKAEECVFLDDKAINIKTSESLGIAGIVFRSQEQAVKELRDLGVKI
ncbi:haloacid dehalogenase [Clostridia bacterium]|nr:haloacid dehalogenase [Clostridia bacterium]